MNDAQIGDLLERLHTSADTASLVAPSGATARIQARSRQLARRRRTSVAAGCAAALVGVAALVLVTIPDGTHRITTTPQVEPTIDSVTPTTGPPVASTTPPAEPTTAPVTSAPTAPSTPVAQDPLPLAPAEHDWQALPPAPLSARASQAVVVLGDTMVVWGGGVPNALDGSEPGLADGAVIDLGTREWRPMSASPLTGGPSTGAAFGGTIFIVDAAGGAGTYDPATDVWASAASPGVALQQMVVWSDELIGTTGDTFLRLTGDGWHEMPQPGSPLQSAQLLLVGDALMVFGETSETTELGYQFVDGAWQALPAIPVVGASGWMAGVGEVADRVVVVGWNMKAARYDRATGAWAALPDVPGFPVKCHPELDGIGSTTVVRMCGFVGVLRDGDGTWTVSSPYPGRIDLGLHHTSDALIAGGATLVGDPGGVLLTPIVVGAITIDPGASPAGTHLVDADVQVALLASQCTLTVSSRAIDQVTQASAAAVATAGPTTDPVRWGGSAGSFELACPDVDAYTVAMSALQTAGERTAAIDASGLIEELGVSSATTPEALIDAVADAISDRFGSEDSSLSVGLVWDDDEATPLIATIELLGFQDDSVEGAAYAIDARSTEAGWMVERITSSSICARGVAFGTDDQLCV